MAADLCGAIPRVDSIGEVVSCGHSKNVITKSDELDAAALRVPPTEVTLRYPTTAAAAAGKDSGYFAHAGFVDHTDETPLNSDQWNAVWRVMNEHPYVRACFSTLVNYLFAESLQIKRKGVVIELPMGEQARLNNIYKPFLTDALRTIITTGLLPILFHEDPARPGALYPLVPVYSTYRIYITTREHRQLYRFYSRGPHGEYHHPGAVVYDDFNWAPTPEGFLASPIAVLLREIRFIVQTIESVSTANAIGCNPFIAVQMRDSAARREEDEANARFFADANMQDLANQTRVDSLSSFSVFMDERRSYDAHMAVAMQASQARTEGLARDGVATGVPQMSHLAEMPVAPQPWRNNVFRIPQDHELVRQEPPAVIRPDLVALRVSVEDTISAVLGVPRDAMMARHTQAASNVGPVTQTFKALLNMWRVALSDVLTRVYCYTEAQNIGAAFIEARMQAATGLDRRARRRAASWAAGEDDDAGAGAGDDDDGTYLTPAVSKLGREGQQEWKRRHKAADALPSLTYEAAVEEMFKVGELELGFPVTHFIPPDETWKMHLQGIVSATELRQMVRNYYGLDTRPSASGLTVDTLATLTDEERKMLLGIKPPPAAAAASRGGDAAAAPRTSVSWSSHAT